MSDFDTSGQRERPDIETTLQAMKNDSQRGKMSSTVFYGLSGVLSDEVQRLHETWSGLPTNYRRKLMRRLVDISEANFEFNFTEIGRIGLSDADAGVRQAAIETLWENNEPSVMFRLIDLATQDDNREVRAAAASALGRFILMGELDELPEKDAVQAQNAVIKLLTSEDEEVEVRRRALEAIANSSHEIVDPSIRDAYQGSDRRMRISAVFAMGRTCDSQWEDMVLQELLSEDDEMRYEAAKAAGELELREAVPELLRLALEDERETKDTAIWSLGEIGSKEAIKALNVLAKDAKRAGDEDLLEAIEDAISNASLMADDSLYMMRLDD
jgi:HEAT repeat protein